MKKNKSPKVSCLLLNCNGISFTRKCLNSLLKTDYDNFEIIVVDNGSENKEAEVLEKEFFKKIKLIKNKINLGYAVGMNQAVKKSTGKYVMILNNDMEFDKKWLSPLVETLEKNDEVGACQPKIKDLKIKNKFEYAGAAGGYIDMWGYPFARGRIFSKIEDDAGQYDQTVKVAWAAIMLIRKTVLKKTGIFDPIYFCYAEDIDLCYRIYGQGYTIVYVPNSVVYHYGGGTFGNNLEKKMFFIHRNHLILIIKNLDIKKLLLTIIPRIMLDIISFFYYIIRGYPKISFSLILAHVSLYRMLPAVLKSRKTTQGEIKKRNSIMPVYHGSIVWDFFIRKKKKFSEIVNDSFKIY